MRSTATYRAETRAGLDARRLGLGRRRSCAGIQCRMASRSSSRHCAGRCCCCRSRPAVSPGLRRAVSDACSAPKAEARRGSAVTLAGSRSWIRRSPCGVLSRVVLGSRCGRGALFADLLAVSIRADRTFIRADRRFAVSAVAWLIVVLVLVVLVVLIGVFVRRRRRAGGVIATRRKR